MDSPCLRKINISIKLLIIRIYLDVIYYVCVESLSFNVDKSSKAQCQGCKRTLIFRYNYSTEVIDTIEWSKENEIFASVSNINETLVFKPSDLFYFRLHWNSSDPASLTLLYLTADDLGFYGCAVKFQSKNYIDWDYTYLDTSLPLCKFSI